MNRPDNSNTMNYKQTKQSMQRAGKALMNLRALGLSLLALVFLAGCATTTGGGGGGSLGKRAQERWDALLAGDFDTAYEYYSPGFRSSHSRGDFEVMMRLRKVQFTDAKYADQDCEGDRCTVTFDVGYRIASPVPGLDTWESTQKLEETWVRTQGQWWFLPDS